MQETKEQLERNDNGIEQRVHRRQTEAMTHFLAFLKKVFLLLFSSYNFFFQPFFILCNIQENISFKILRIWIIISLFQLFMTQYVSNYSSDKKITNMDWNRDLRHFVSH